MGTLLQAFLALNLLLVGGLLVIAWQHAREHLKRPTARPSSNGLQVSSQLSSELVAASHAKFEAALTRSAAQLQAQLGETSAQLNKTLERLGAEIVVKEMGRYRSQVEQLRATAEAAVVAAHSSVSEHQAAMRADIARYQVELRAGLEADIAQEKSQLLSRIDTSLSDAVASFLVETLQHNADLGAQTAYLTAMLEEHKDEIKKGVEGVV